jgi:hypothetical protein
VDDQRDPVDAATRFVAARFPHARVAFVGGSVVTERRTPTSDLDVVVVLDGPPAPYRETTRFEGWVVELFVHTDESRAYFFGKDLDDRRCSLARMIGFGVVVADRDGTAADVQADARRRVDAGPGPLDDGQRDALRYALTDLLDDLAGGADPDELAWILAAVATRTAELALGIAGRWNGMGKWLHRELADLDPDLAARLGAAWRAADVPALDGIAREVLDRAGGPLLEGYRVAAELPA